MSVATTVAAPAALACKAMKPEPVPISSTFSPGPGSKASRRR
jgi:hypothetical protein